MLVNICYSYNFSLLYTWYRPTLIYLYDNNTVIIKEFLFTSCFTNKDEVYVTVLKANATLRTLELLYDLFPVTGVDSLDNNACSKILSKR